MCRHLAYLGPEAPIGDLLTRPPHGLLRQSWQPRRQRHGTVNADGFGIGWYAAGDPVPARYRRPGPIWADPSVMDLARVVRTTALLGAVRDATEPGADGEAAAAPFASGPWLFSHNGSVRGWPGSMAGLVATLPPPALLEMEARCDAAFIWALALHRLRAGAPLGRALAETVVALDEAAPGSRLNLLLTDGTTIAATAWGDGLWYHAEPAAVSLAGDRYRPASGGGSVVVASEPYDDDPGWVEVPEGTLVTASRSGVRLTPIADRFAAPASATDGASGTHTAVPTAPPGPPHRPAHPSPSPASAPAPDADRPWSRTPASTGGHGHAASRAAEPPHLCPPKESSL